MILMHIWHFEAPFVLRGVVEGVWGGTGDISCSHNVIHYGRGALERVQRALLVCATTHLSLCPPLFLSHSPSLSLSVGEMAAAFFLSPRGLRDIPACFPLIRQTYSTYLSLSPLLSLLQLLLLEAERCVIFGELYVSAVKETCDICFHSEFCCWYLFKVQMLWVALLMCWELLYKASYCYVAK